MNSRLLQVEEMRARQMTYKAIGIALGVSGGRAYQLHRNILRRREQARWCEVLRLADEQTDCAREQALARAFRGGFRTLAGIRAADDRTILASRGIGKAGLATLRGMGLLHMAYEGTA